MYSSSAISEKIMHLRKARGLTQDAFAELIGVSKGGVSSFELEKSKPSIDNLIKIAEEFQVTVDWLLSKGTGDTGGQVIKENTFTSSGAVSGGQSLTGWGTQTSFTPQGMDLNLVATLEEKIAGLEKLIAEKDERIQDLKQTIADLRNKS